MATFQANSFTIDIRHSLDAFERRLTEVEKGEMPFATAAALTATAKDAQAAVVAEMQQAFDRPTKFALNSLYIRPATKQNLVSGVYWKDGFGSIPASRFLQPEVEGGPRVKKSFERRLERAGILRPHEFIVPGQGIKLDANGNMKGGEIERILSQLGAAEQMAGYQANMTARSQPRNVKRAGGRYFVVRGRGVPDGIYQRKGKEIIPVMMFVKQPQYQKRLRFYEVVQATVARRFGANFASAWQRYVIPSLNKRYGLRAAA